ncbi:MAG TPA: amidohydrolase family protein [Longimicrobium sp.]|nr:amidohydrolase family protein [Longimicrobium sp.]
MSRSRILLCACLALAGALPAAAQQERLALTHVTIVDVDSGGLRADHTVLIDGNRITWTGPAAQARIPVGARVVDAPGRYVIPGLWDMHVHTSREGRARHFWPLFLAHGVTGVREMGSYLDTLQYWRAEARRPGAVAPHIVFSSPMLDGVPPNWRHGYGVADSAAAATAVDSMRALGFDFLKVYNRLSREAYYSIARQARLRGMTFAGHVPWSITTAEASDAGQRSIEHVSDPFFLECIPGGPQALAAFLAARTSGAPADSVQAALGRLRAVSAIDPDPAACRGLHDRLARNGTWLTPTLTQLRGARAEPRFADDPRMRFVPTALAQRWREGVRPQTDDDRRIQQLQARAVGIAHAAGVRMLAGTDASDEPFVYAGSTLHEEMWLLVEMAGLTPLEALRTATLNPALYLDAADSMGSVRAGRMADLVVLNANPLEDIHNTMRIHAVVANGRLIDGPERERLLAGAAEEAARAGTSAPARQED